MSKQNQSPLQTHTDHDLFYDFPDKIGDKLRTINFTHWGIYTPKTIRPIMEKLLNLPLASLNQVLQDMIDRVEEKRNQERKYEIIYHLIESSLKYKEPIEKTSGEM